MDNNKHPLKVAQIKDWLDNPVTREFKQKILLSIDDTEEALLSKILHTPDAKLALKGSLGEILGYKAQIQVLEMISDLEAFIKIEEELDDEEIYPSGGSDSN